jgi:hypothetical protein
MVIVIYVAQVSASKETDQTHGFSERNSDILIFLFGVYSSLENWG